VPVEQREAKDQLAELLQELRVALPGVQVLLAVLLTIPFDARFADLDQTERNVFFSAILSAAAATVLMIAPSAQHRFAWPVTTQEMAWILRIGTIEARLGLIALAISISASVYVVAALVFGASAGLIVGILVGGLAGLLWIALPMAGRRRLRGRAPRT
jgi:hypothetical protein